MNITIEELEKLEPGTFDVIDMRGETEIAHGAIPGSVAIPEAGAFGESARKYGKETDHRLQPRQNRAADGHAYQPVRILRRFYHHYRFILSRRFDGDQQPYCRRACPLDQGALGAQVRPRGRYADPNPLHRRGLDAAQAPDPTQQRRAQLGKDYGHDRPEQKPRRDGAAESASSSPETTPS